MAMAATSSPAGSRPRRGHRRAGAGGAPPAGSGPRPGVADQPVAHRPRDLDHAGPDSRHPHPRWAVGARRRGEHRGHQRVGVEVAAEVEWLPLVPAPPDRPHGLDQLAHPRRRPGPGHRVATLDVRPDLAAEPQHEPPTREHLHVVAEVRQRHRRAGEGDGDGGPQLDALGVLGGHGQGQEPVVARLEREQPRVAVGLGGAGLRARPGEVVHQVGVDLHPRSLPGVHAPPLFPGAARPWNHRPMTTTVSPGRVGHRCRPRARRRLVARRQLPLGRADLPARQPAAPRAPRASST